MGRWKAVRNDLDEPIELYDVEVDVGETKDLSSEHPELVRRIEDLMHTARTESEFWPKRR